MFTSDCECYADGTTNNGNVEMCNAESGKCDCETGYTGDKCDECDAGYYDQNHGSGNMSCISKY